MQGKTRFVRRCENEEMNRFIEISYLIYTNKHFPVCVLVQQSRIMELLLVFFISNSFLLGFLDWFISGFPVAQLVEHGANNAKIMGSIPRESKSWSNVKL